LEMVSPSKFIGSLILESRRRKMLISEKIYFKP
jgi:hypothetical protein